MRRRREKEEGGRQEKDLGTKDLVGAEVSVRATRLELGHLLLLHAELQYIDFTILGKLFQEISFAYLGEDTSDVGVNTRGGHTRKKEEEKEKEEEKGGGGGGGKRGRESLAYPYMSWGMPPMAGGLPVVKAFQYLYSTRKRH